MFDIIGIWLVFVTIICFVAACSFIHESDWFGIPLLVISLIALICSVAIFTHDFNKYKHTHYRSEYDDNDFWEDYHPPYYNSYADELERERLQHEIDLRRAQIIAEEHRQCVVRIDAQYKTTVSMTPGERAIFNQLLRQEEETKCP